MHDPLRDCKFDSPSCLSFHVGGDQLMQLQAVINYAWSGLPGDGIV